MELKGNKKQIAKERAERGQRVAGETETQKCTYLSTVHELDDLFFFFFQSVPA